MIHDLFNHHDPPLGPKGVIQVLKFVALEPELLENYLEQVRVFADTIIASISFESDTILVIKIHSFKTNPSAFNTFFLVELKSFERITRIYQGEEESCQEDI